MKPMKYPNTPPFDATDITDIWSDDDGKSASETYDEIAEALTETPGRWWLVRSERDARGGSRGSAQTALRNALIARGPRFEVKSVSRPYQPWRVFARYLSVNASGAERRREPMPPPNRPRQRVPDTRWLAVVERLVARKGEWLAVTEARPLPVSAGAARTPRRNLTWFDPEFEFRTVKSGTEWWVEARCVAVTDDEMIEHARAQDQAERDEIEAEITRLKKRLAVLNQGIE